MKGGKRSKKGGQEKGECESGWPQKENRGRRRWRGLAGREEREAIGGRGGKKGKKEGREKSFRD